MSIQQWGIPECQEYIVYCETKKVDLHESLWEIKEAIDKGMKANQTKRLASLRRQLMGVILEMDCLEKQMKICEEEVTRLRGTA